MTSTITLKPPRMMTDADLACVAAVVADTPKGRTAVEFGPWLGGVSIAMAERLNLHAVDRFSWTSDHAKKVPDLLPVGGDFRSNLEEMLLQAGVQVTLHKSTFDNFVWTGEEIDLLMVDGPKTAASLKSCLLSVIDHLTPFGSILIKNGLGPLYSDVTAYLERLVHEGILIIPPQTVQPSCNVLHLNPGAKIAQFNELKPHDPEWEIQGTLLQHMTLADAHPYRFVRVLAAIGAADWDAATQNLVEMSPEPELAAAWSNISKKNLTTTSNAAMIDQLSDLVAFHHEQPAAVDLPIKFGKNRESMLRGYWANTVDQPWRSKAYHPEILTKAFDFGYMDWPDKVKEHVYGKDVLDVGCGPGLHGLGYLAAGAKSYLGLDPILQSDRDRSKNRTAARKEPFGWTPNQISRAVPPWHASPEAVGDTSLERRFDLCTLHSVTEHLHRLEDVFVDIAARLRRDGKILYYHHNFYCWNGHHQPPKSVSKLELSDPKQREMTDWNHISFEPGPDHYITRGLNRIKLDELIEITAKYFDIDEMTEVPTTPQKGIDRLTDDIRKRHSDLTERDLTTQGLFCVATVRV